MSYNLEDAVAREMAKQSAKNRVASLTEEEKQQMMAAYGWKRTDEWKFGTRLWEKNGRKVSRTQALKSLIWFAMYQSGEIYRTPIGATDETTKS